MTYIPGLSVVTFPAWAGVGLVGLSGAGLPCPVAWAGVGLWGRTPPLGVMVGASLIAARDRYMYK